MISFVENLLMITIAALNGCFFASLMVSLSHSGLVSPVAAVSGAFFAVTILAYLWAEKLYICQPVKVVTK